MPHGLKPPSEEDSPSAPLETQAKVERTRSPLLWQWGQEAASSARLMGRSNSNLSLQLEQRYSYIGIVPHNLLYPVLRVSQVLSLLSKNPEADFRDSVEAAACGC